MWASGFRDWPQKLGMAWCRFPELRVPDFVGLNPQALWIFQAWTPW
jgi:hypothetical protein